MKKSIFLWLIGGIYTANAFAQSRVADSLKLLLQKENQDTIRVLLLADIGTYYKYERPEAGFAYIQQGLDLARSLNYSRGEARCLNDLGSLYRMTGNYSTALKYHLDALQIFEKINDPNGILASDVGMATSYLDQGDYKEALLYFYKSMSILHVVKSPINLQRVQTNMGVCFLHLGQLDSALKYEQYAYELDINTPTEALVLGRLGSIHSAMGNYDLALSFYHMGIPLAILNSDNNALNEILVGVSTLFQKQAKYDSSIYYAKQALITGYKMGSPQGVLDASNILFSNYKRKNVADSALKYLELSTITKDTLITQDKLKQEQVLAFEEKNRQVEIANKLKSAAAKRKQNIQYAAIVVGLISFLLLFILLSRSIIINAKWVRFLGILALLISFEFLNLVIHPSLSHYTRDSPILMLSALVIIGAILIPLHHRIEKWVIAKMTEKNKRIRLVAAKKIIASIEGNSGVRDI